MSEAAIDPEQAEIKKNWRFYLGLTFVILALVMPLLSIVIVRLDLSSTLKGAIIGALTLGGPEVALVAAAACMGKDMLNVLKGKAFGWLRNLLPSQPASKFRYYASLVAILLTQVQWYVYGWAPQLIPEDVVGSPYLIAGDVIFVVAFLAAGPEFYEKIGRLLRWEGVLANES